MDLSFLELQKRDVINVVDGRCLGRITDLVLNFPEGIMTGIVVPGKRLNFFSRLFNRAEIFIDRERIIKIGNDVILVNIKCGEACSPSVRVNADDCKRPPKPPHPHKAPSCDELFGGCNKKANFDNDDDYGNL